MKPHRILEALNSIKSNNGPAPYKNKDQVVDILRQAVLNGSNEDYKKIHVVNIKNIVGKHRILD